MSRIQDLEANKRNAMAFYRTAYQGNPSKAVEVYVGAEYIQHNPEVANGKQGFIDYFEQMHQDYPDKGIEFVRAIAEADLVALHTHQTWPGNVEYVTMDFFVSMTAEKLSNTGIPFRRFRKKRRMETQCTDRTDDKAPQSEKNARRACILAADARRDTSW